METNISVETRFDENDIVTFLFSQSQSVAILILDETISNPELVSLFSGKVKMHA